MGFVLFTERDNMAVTNWVDMAVSHFYHENLKQFCSTNVLISTTMVEMSPV